MVPAYIRIVGKAHPQTLLSMRNLATCYEVAGRRQEARRMRKQANQGRESEEEDSTREFIEELLPGKDIGCEIEDDSGEEMEEVSEEVLPEKDSVWEVEDDSGEYMEEDSEDSEEDGGEEMKT